MRGYALQRMLSTGDNIVLRIRRQGGEERRVARDAHHQVTILVRMFLRLQQRFARDDVVLDMPALCTSKKVRSSTISFWRSLSFSSVDGFSFWFSSTPRESLPSAVYHRANYRRRAEVVRTGGRACSFRQRGVRLTSVRRGHRCRAKRHVCGDGRGARVVVTSNRAAAVARVVVLLSSSM